VLLGAPGVGKGTQAELLGRRLGACQLSTGDVFRASKSGDGCETSPALRQALEFMRRGELVPDQTVLAMVKERLACLRCHGGFLLDGFPRTVAQAEALEGILAGLGVGLDSALSYELALEKIVARLSGRRVCSRCKSVFHVDALPARMEGRCNCCGTRLEQREDDRSESVRVRIQVHELSAAPLIDYYRRRGLLVSIAAEGGPEEVFARTLKALEFGQAGSMQKNPYDSQ
jgi:adenylate kinase